jgi:hypothetical protein
VDGDDGWGRRNSSIAGSGDAAPMAPASHRRPSRTAHRAALPNRPITVTDAARAGWTQSAARHAIRVGDIERVRRGVLGRVEPIHRGILPRRVQEAANLRRAQAATLTCPRAALADVHLHRASLPDDGIVHLDGYRALGAARTVMDLARERGVAAGVVAADYALHHGLVDTTSLAAAFEVCSRWPGRKAARITLLRADGRAESPLESLSRLEIASARLPAPEPQPSICDRFGQFLGRCDFYWDEFGVVGESDGDQKYAEGRPAIVAERTRHQLFEDTGLVVVRWGWADLFSFDSVARRLRTAYSRGARRGTPVRRWGILRPEHGLHSPASQSRRSSAR